MTKDLTWPNGRNKVACHVCRLNSTLSRKKCEQLVTNHVALRLLKVVESSQARAIENKKKQLWCIDSCDQALKGCHTIQSVHKVVLAWIRWLELEITRRDASIITTIAQLECLKSTEVFDVSVEGDMQKNNYHVDELIESVKNLEKPKLWS
ncbi:hypothetical protein OUZ56_021616 [Daphnia magna]|uniref:Uncharacterized protein n=1 Tax=Daphnia magna TaxID=35525 RepID=A0ABR0AU19_9CRUS|nr:hypothetical protein OUZ56_021616 [Daphnia magna]